MKELESVLTKAEKANGGKLSDNRKFRQLMAHFYVAVVFIARSASVDDSLTDWMETKSAKCGEVGCKLCVEPEDSGFIYKQNRRINGDGK